MPPTVQEGSQGPPVATLQTAMNLLPSAKAPLTIDSIFGLLTDERVREFQNWSRILVDGIVGPQTWGTIESLIGTVRTTLENLAATERKRQAILDAALDEFRLHGAGIRAKKPGDPAPGGQGKFFRAGRERLQEYFDTAAPNTFSSQSIQILAKENELAPCPHWCGIFALFCHKQAQMDVGNWVIGSGISSVRGFRPTATPSKGDVGFANNGFEHHVVIERSFLKNGAVFFDTVEGNSGTDSRITHNLDQPRSRFASFFTAF